MMLFIVLFFSLAVIPTQVSALEITAPDAPKSIAEVLPDNTENIGKAIPELIQNILQQIRPEFEDICKTCIILFASLIIISILYTFSESTRKASIMAGAVAIASVLMRSTSSLITVAAETVYQLSDYGKLLWPVMATAMAAQGALTSSAAIYTATAAFDAVLTNVISRFLVPLVYAFLALSLGNYASGEDILRRLKDLIKSIVNWGLKTLLTIFTTYISITGVVSGTADAAALKATKVTISSVVPVVGGILSDASEAVLVSASLMKNTAGIYGIIVILALFLDPFVRIGIAYLFLKFTSALSGIFAPKEISGLIEDFSAAMGLLLAMTGSACLMLLISVFCFMKGVG